MFKYKCYILILTIFPGIFNLNFTKKNKNNFCAYWGYVIDIPIFGSRTAFITLSNLHISVYVSGLKFCKNVLPNWADYKKRLYLLFKFLIKKYLISKIKTHFY